MTVRLDIKHLRRALRKKVPVRKYPNRFRLNKRGVAGIGTESSKANVYFLPGMAYWPKDRSWPKPEIQPHSSNDRFRTFPAIAIFTLNNRIGLGRFESLA